MRHFRVLLCVNRTLGAGFRCSTDWRNL